MGVRYGINVGMETKPSFVAYIDEAGDEGFKTDEGASKYFVLSAIICRLRDERALSDVVDLVHNAFSAVQPAYNRKKALHFRNLRHEQRKLLTSKIVGLPIKSVSIVVSKVLMRATAPLLSEQNIYHYTSGELVKHVLLYCNNLPVEEGDGTVQFVFSNRSTLNYDLLGSYCENLIELDTSVYILKREAFSQRTCAYFSS